MPIPNSIAAAEAELREWRRDFHAHPELGYEETRTAAAIAERLRAFGLDAVETGIGKTGVVGVLHGRGGPGPEGKAVMLRADMDALPITEENAFDHISTTSGKMHACGHDGHTTMLLGAAKHLAETRAFDGTVYFCFQPAEEGGAGAHAMMQDGLFDRFPCRAVYGMHNFPGQPVGTFTTKVGPIFAATGEFDITLTGRGGHAAAPHQTCDPIAAGATLYAALQTIVSRKVDPMKPAVLSVTQFHAGFAHNVIPSEATLAGTVRTYDDDVHEMIFAEIVKRSDEIAAAHGMTATVKRSTTDYPVTSNDAAETGFVLDVAGEVAGPDNADDGFPGVLGGEDFAFYTKEKPCGFILIGNGDTASLHHPKYDFNDEIAPLGVAYWSRLVERALPA